MADYSAYVAEQGLADELKQAMTVVLKEKPADAKKRLIELLSAAAEPKYQVPTSALAPTSDIAVIGLAVMGQNLILNMNDHGCARWEPRAARPA